MNFKLFGYNISIIKNKVVRADSIHMLDLKSSTSEGDLKFFKPTKGSFVLDSKNLDSLMIRDSQIKWNQNMVWFIADSNLKVLIEIKHMEESDKIIAHSTDEGLETIKVDSNGYWKDITKC